MAVDIIRTCQKEFLLFYMCQLWSLHVVIKRRFYIYCAVLRMKNSVARLTNIVVSDFLSLQS